MSHRRQIAGTLALGLVVAALAAPAEVPVPPRGHLLIIGGGKRPPELEHPELLGVGIDESTAILVRPDRTFEVLGKSQVVVVDASAATGISAGHEGQLSGRGLALHLLRDGQRFDLGARRPLP